MKKLITLFALLLSITMNSQTIIPGGDVSGTWDITGSPYIIQGDVEILNTLTITEGVQVVFDSCYYFEVHGSLNLYGSAADSIIFTVADTTGYFNNTHYGWEGIQFKYGSSCGPIRYCKIEYAKSTALDFFYTSISGGIYDCTIQYCGGGIFYIESFQDTLKKIIIRNNLGGSVGKYYSWPPKTHLINFEFINNGSGIYGDQNGSYAAENGIIKNNRYGGVHLGSESHSSFKNVIIDNNGSFDDDGGGVWSSTGTSFTDCEITNNKAKNGGGVYASGMAWDNVRIYRTLIMNNTALKKGGGIYGTRDGVKVVDSKIIENTAENGGGFYYYNDGGNHEKDFINVAIVGNSASQYGGGIFSEGGIIYNFDKLTIAKNTAGVGGGGIYQISSSPFTETTIFNNTIVWGNIPDEIVDSTGLVELTYSNINGGWPGTGNINIDPLFVSLHNNDFHLCWANYPANDYTKSPCIDNGNPLSDPDPDGTAADMGAYFFDQSSQLPYLLDLKVFMEGPFFSNQMTPFLNAMGFLPLSQPYGYGPMYHAGIENVNSIPNANILDWIFIEIRKNEDIFNPYPYSAKSRQAAFLLKDGNIVGLDGSSLPEIYTDDLDSLHLCLYHRNHLPVVSFFALDTVLNIIEYDFTVSDQMAIGENHIQKQLSPGIWGMIAGDGNADAQVNNSDKNDVWFLHKGQMGYLNGDFDMNSQVDDTDLNNKWKVNSGKGVYKE